MSLELALGFTIFSFLFYHLSQKSISSSVNPIVSLLISYCTSVIICLAILVFFPPKAGMVESFKDLNWATFVLGLAAAGIELGYLLAYRLGLSLSIGSVLPHVVVAMIFVAFETIFLRTHLSTNNYIGLVFCTLGLVFVYNK
jgi:uncharacterized membrane protein